MTEDRTRYIDRSVLMFRVLREIARRRAIDVGSIVKSVTRS